jgi:hypothetical protein
MAINRAAIAKQLVPGLNKVFGMEYGSVDDEHKPLYEMEGSDRSYEEEVLFTGFGTAPVKEEGSGVQYDDAQESYSSRYVHETIALAFSITEEAMEDNLYDSFSKLRAKGLGRAMGNTKQVKAADPFNNGFSTAYLGGDGSALFAADHTTIGDGDQSNTLGAVDLSEAALETALITIHKAVDDRGILIGLQCKSIHIPPDLIFTCEQLLNSPMSTTIGVNPGTATNGATNVNDINAIKTGGYVSGGSFVNHRFTDTNGWFLQTDCPDGTKMFTRAPLQTKMEPDFDTGNLRYKARERYSFGWSNFRRWYGSSGS